MVDVIDADSRDASCRWLRTSAARWPADAPARRTAALAARDFHSRLETQAPTPLVDAPKIAEALGVRRVVVKDEAGRMGLNAFKVLGASYAMFAALSERLAAPLPEDWLGWADLERAFAPLRDLTFTASTAGNHGRAVAHVARRLGFRARVLIPAGAPTRRVARIEAEGAAVEMVDGSFDDAVALASRADPERELLIADTAWDGYEQVPDWITTGYATLFAEVDEQLAGPPLGPRDFVALQIGVGTFAAGGVRHYAQRARPPRLIGVEPSEAACLIATAAAGRLTRVAGPYPSAMDCLNVGVPSAIALPDLDAIDLFTAVGDEHAHAAVALLAGAGVDASPTGASGLAGLLGLRRAAPRLLDACDRVVVVNTEGSIT